MKVRSKHTIGCVITRGEIYEVDTIVLDIGTIVFFLYDDSGNWGWYQTMHFEPV